MRLRQWIGLLAGVLALAVLALIGAVWLASQPAPARIGDPPMDLPAKRVAIASPSGVTLVGWLLYGGEGHGVVVLMHDLGANRLAELDHMRLLHEAGYTVLAFDFRGHGESIGRAPAEAAGHSGNDQGNDQPVSSGQGQGQGPSKPGPDKPGPNKAGANAAQVSGASQRTGQEGAQPAAATEPVSGLYVTFGYAERLDAEAAVSWIHQELPDERIAVLGTGMGAAAAMLTPKLPVKAMILEAPPRDIDRLIASRLEQSYGPAAQVAMPLLLGAAHWLLGIETQGMRPIDRIAEIGVPVLVIGGVNDPVTPIDEVDAIYRRARDPKAFWAVAAAASPADFPRVDRIYRQEVIGFLDRYLPQR